VKVAPWVAAVLAEGFDDLLSRYPDCKITQAEFSEFSIPLLAWLGLIVLIHPRRTLPDWL
jgi:hypothetical protein